MEPCHRPSDEARRGRRDAVGGLGRGAGGERERARRRIARRVNARLLPCSLVGVELDCARVIVETAERMNRHDRRDHEQEDRALAAVAVDVSPGGLAAVDKIRAEDQDRERRSSIMSA